MNVLTNRGIYRLTFLPKGKIHVLGPDGKIVHVTDSQLDAEIFCYMDGTHNVP